MPRIWPRLSGIQDVDTLATETTVSDEIDTSTASPPVTVVTPSSGRRIDTRSVYLASDSTGGKVVAKYRDSGEVLGVIYCSKFAIIPLDSIRKTGDVGEPIVIDWSDLDTGAKIYYAIRYKEL